MKFFKIATCGKFFLECVSNGIFYLKMSFYPFVEVFLTKIRKNLKLEKLENMMEELSILKKTLSSFYKASLTMLEGAKYPEGSRVSSLFFPPKS